MKYEFETVNCNLCNSDNYQKISSKGKFGLPTNVVICKNCGLSYLNPRWNNASYLDFYQNEYDKYYRPQIIKEKDLKRTQINPIEIRLNKFNLFPEKVEQILDIGSGEGNNLFHFKSLFPNSELHAIEPSIESQNHLIKFNVNIIGSDVDTDWDADYKEKFDIIIMRHVLEHFLDPVKMMKKVSRVLKPNGIVYVAVPNNLKPTQSLEKSWFRNVHTYYFNKYSLENLNKLVGLKTIQMVEGDELNKGEVFFIAKKSNKVEEPVFSAKDYETQSKIFLDKLKVENKLSYKLVSLIKKVLKKLRG